MIKVFFIGVAVGIVLCIVAQKFGPRLMNAIGNRLIRK